MQTPLNVGVDVSSKTVLAACAARSFAPRTLSNQAKVLRSWLKRLPAGTRVGVEATGRYHQLVADLAHAAGLTVYVLNPRDVKKYAEGVGRRGKTDRVDAEMIARFVAREHDRLHAYVPLSAAQRQLEQLLKRRGKLVALRVALELGWSGVAGVKKELAALGKAHAGLLRQVDHLIAQAVAALPEVAVRARQVRTIPGYGQLGSVAIAHALTRLPFTKVDAFIAHTGLDPRPDDSGDKRGRRRLSKRGPAELRRVMHTCAMSAARSKVWRPYYLAQRAKGLSGTAALVVLARKMARTAYGICKHNVAFDPSRVMSTA
jgi:transposase